MSRQDVVLDVKGQQRGIAMLEFQSFKSQEAGVAA